MEIKKLHCLIITVAVLGFSMVSCENENIDTPASVSEVNGLNASQSNDNGQPMTKSLSKRNRSGFGTPLATGVVSSQREVFSIPPHSSVYVETDRTYSLEFYVKNESASPINVKYYTRSGNSYTLVKKRNISYHYGSLVMWEDPYTCYSGLLVKMTNNNSHTVSGCVWNANFKDGN